MLFGAQPQTPEETRTMLADEIFPRWCKITGGKAVRNANQLKLRQKTLYGLWYLPKGIQPTDEKQKRQPHWHGTRKRGIIVANARPVTKQEVRTAWNFVFAGRKPVKPEPPAEPTNQVPDIAGMKVYLEWTGGAIGWEAFKQAETGRKGKFSDEDLIAFYNRQGQSAGPRPASDPDTL